MWENELSDFGEQLGRQLNEKRRKTKRKASSCQKEGPREIFLPEISDSLAVPVTCLLELWGFQLRGQLKFNIMGKLTKFKHGQTAIRYGPSQLKVFTLD